MYLNNSNQIIGCYPHSIGSITGAVVDTRLVMAAALQCGAVSLILVHNHPSSRLEPSKADLDITRKLQRAAKFLELSILDHIIIGKTGYYSFADEDELCF